MGFLFLILVMYVILLAMFLSSGVGAGLLLHWWFPDLDLGSAVLASVIANAIIWYFLLRLYLQLPLMRRVVELDEAPLGQIPNRQRKKGK